GTGNAVSAGGKVSVSVTGTNDQPVVSDLVFTRTEDEGSKDFSFVVNDLDDADSHTFTLTSTLPAGSGTLVNENDGKFSFDPGSDFQDLAEGETRDVSFAYRATDNSGTANAISTDAMVTISVTGENDRPVVSDIVINAIEDGLAVTGSFVVSDIDDSDAHTFAITSNPDEGSVLNNNDGTFSFDPGSDFQDLPAGETRVVDFEYEATDDSGGGSDTSAKAEVSVTVTGTNDAPVLDNAGNMALGNVGSQNTNPAGVSVAALIVSAGGDRITDADNAAAEGIAVTGVDDGNGEWQYDTGSGWVAFGPVSDAAAVLLDPTALVRFVPDAGYSGSAGFTFRAWDQTSGSNGLTGVNVLLDNGGDSAFSQQSETAAVTVVDGVLWLTTKGDEANSGINGMDAWEKGDLLQFGTPDLALESPATSGAFASAFDIDRFAAGANTNALHYVTQDIALGSSGFQLEAGDLLLSLEKDTKTLTSSSVPDAAGFTNSLTVNDEDVFVFRPDSAGDYSAGTFAMLLENPLGADIRALTLVEHNTTVGDIVVQKGDFLLSASGGAFDKKVTLWESGNIGAGSTSGIPVTLLNGSDVNVKLGGHIWGMDLVERSISVGGQTLESGTILLSVDANTEVGKNSLSIRNNDIFALAVAKTTLVAGAGNGEATASLIFAGADVGLDAGDEDLDGLAVVVASLNAAPLANDDGSLTVPVSTAEDTAVAIDVLANDTDPDGSLDPATVSISSSPANGTLGVNAVTGVVTYTPNANYTGSDSFTYTVRDDSGDTSNFARVLLEVTPVNDAPLVTPVDLGNSDEDTGRLITQAELLAGVSDVDNLPGELAAGNLAVTGGSGTLVDHADGTWTFTPTLDWSGGVTFGFVVSDGSESTANTATLTVDPLNDAPQVDAVTSDTGAQDTDRVYSQDELLSLLNATDVDDADAALTIAISNVVNGGLS
ncbi:MAG: tandem-95 repeat protein, partial [Gammaproteobacteria bacterium]